MTAQLKGWIGTGLLTVGAVFGAGGLVARNEVEHTETRTAVHRLAVTDTTMMVRLDSLMTGRRQDGDLIRSLVKLRCLDSTPAVLREAAGLPCGALLRQQ